MNSIEMTDNCLITAVNEWMNKCCLAANFSFFWKCLRSKCGRKGLLTCTQNYIFPCLDTIKTAEKSKNSKTQLFIVNDHDFLMMNRWRFCHGWSIAWAKQTRKNSLQITSLYLNNTKSTNIFLFELKTVAKSQSTMRRYQQRQWQMSCDFDCDRSFFSV